MKMIMRTLGVAGLMVIIALCCSCAPNLKSMKDVDCYVDSQRTKSKHGVSYSVSTIHQQHPGLHKENTSKGYTATVVSSPPLTAANTVLSFPLSVVKPPNMSNVGVDKAPYLEYSAVIYFQKAGTIYRKETGKPEWDLFAEAVKQAGKVPESTSCVFEGIGHTDGTMPGDQEYIGEDGHIKTAKYLGVFLHFKRDPNANPPCDEVAMKIYQDYLEKVCGNIKNMMDEQFSQPSPYCSNKGA